MFGCALSDQSVRDLEYERELYTKTASYEAARQVLEEDGVVFLVGSPGCGKTTTARKLARSVCKSDKNIRWEPLCLKNSKEWREHVLSKRHQVILMEDIFGSNDFDSKSFYKWKALNMETLHDVKTKKIIFTFRMHVLNEALQHLLTFALFKSARVVELDADKLSIHEKDAMLSKHLKFFHLEGKIGTDVIKAIVSSDTLSNFPSCCRSFCNERRLQSLENAVRFFTNPVEHFEKHITVLYGEKNKVKFAALLLTLVMKGKLNLHLLDDNKTSEIPEEFGHHLRAAGIPTSVTLASIKSCTRCLLGTYLERHSDYICAFSHPSVHDAVSLVYGRKHHDDLLKICSLSFLHQFVTVAERHAADRLKIVLKPDDSGLVQRFVADINNGCPVHVCMHEAFSQEVFAKNFVMNCDDSWLTGVQQDGQLPLLYWTTWSGHCFFFKEIFKLYVSQKKKLDKTLVNQIANACCVSNNVEVLKLLYKCLKTDLLQIASIDIPMPLENILAFKDVTTHRDITTGNVVFAGKLIHIACFNGSSEVVEFLLSIKSGGSCVNTPDEFGRTPGHIAAKMGHIRVFQTLLRHKCNLTLPSRVRNLPIHEACSGGHLQIVEMILTVHRHHLCEKGGAEQNTPLYVAVANRHARLVGWLLDLELGSVDDHVQVHFYGPVLTADLLIENVGIYEHWSGSLTTHILKHVTNQRSDHNWASSLIHLACSSPGNSQVLRMLCERLKNRKDEEDYFLKISPKLNTPLHAVCERTADVKMAAILIEFGVDVNATNVKHQTALHLACRNENCSMRLVQTLIDGQINMFVKDLSGMTALDYCSRNEKVKKYLEDRFHASIE